MTILPANPTLHDLVPIIDEIHQRVDAIMEAAEPLMQAHYAAVEALPGADETPGDAWNAAWARLREEDGYGPFFEAVEALHYACAVVEKPHAHN